MRETLVRMDMEYDLRLACDIEVELDDVGRPVGVRLLGVAVDVSGVLHMLELPSDPLRASIEADLLDELRSSDFIDSLEHGPDPDDAYDSRVDDD